MKKKIIYLIILIFIVVASLLLIITINNKSNKDETKYDDGLSAWSRFNDKKISLDDYVVNLLDHHSFFSDVDQLVYNNLDKLSESTINYYIKKINLSDVTFKLDKENENNKKLSLVDYLIQPVHAKSKITNLNKVILSKNNNFIVWYTTSGDSKISLNDAKKIADGLEDSVEKYRKMLGYNYNFESRNLSKGRRYQDKVKILETNNIDVNYLDSAMQVYLVEYDDSALARYVTRKTASKLNKQMQEFFKTDANGAIAQPYILIKPSSITDYERLEQLYNHELFHHYQYEILCGHLDCDLIKDEYIEEATANWASSIITFKTNNEGFLNEWAGAALKYSDRLLSEDKIKKNGKTNLSYGLYVYLNNYSSFVNEGTNKVLSSIYSDNSFKYLYESATLDELSKVQENIALNNLSQSYSNKNLLAAPSYGATLPIKQNITKKIPINDRTYTKNLPPFAIEYYKVAKRNLIATIEKNYNIAAYLISADNGKYEVVDKVTDNLNSYTFDLNKYDNVYIAVANIIPSTSNEYKITFNVPSKKAADDNVVNNKDNNNSKTSLHKISFDDCNASIDEELIRKIDTYYYDDNDNVTKLRVTLFFSEGSDLEPWIETASSSLYENLKIEKNKLVYDYTSETFNKVYGNQKIDFFKDVHYKYACGNAVVDYDPDKN